jgi:hypothetical protein
MVDLFNPISKNRHLFNAGAQVVSGVVDFTTSGGTFVLPRHSSDPTSWADGQSLIGGELIYRTDTNAVKIYNGTSWSAVGSGVSAHSALTGLSADDHSQYIFYRPTVVRTNTITSQNPSAIGLTIVGHTSQLVELLNVQSGGNTALIDKDCRGSFFGLSAQDQLITDVLSPSSSNDAVNKEYVDELFIDGLPAETSIANDDYVVIYDTSASTQKKMTRANFTSGLGGGGGGGYSYFPSGW